MERVILDELFELYIRNNKYIRVFVWISMPMSLSFQKYIICFGMTE